MVLPDTVLSEQSTDLIQETVFTAAYEGIDGNSTLQRGGSLECRMRHWHLESLEDDRHASEPQIDVYPNDQCKTKQLKECFDACKG